jgi:Family of unknown function (DUF6318)
MPRSLLMRETAISRPARVALGAALGVGLLGGCSFGSSDPSPTPTSARPTTTASPTPTTAASPSPTTTPKPDRPAAMGTVNLDGAIATATYFLDLYPYVANSGDLADWKVLSHPECIFCRSVTTEVERMFSLGHHQDGTETTVLGTSGIEVDPGAWYTVDVQATQGASAEVDSAGAVVEEVPQTKSFVVHVIVVHSADGWQIRAAEPVQADE